MNLSNSNVDNEIVTMTINDNSSSKTSSFPQSPSDFRSTHREDELVDNYNQDRRILENQALHSFETDEYESDYMHRNKCPVKTTVLAVILLAVGLACLIMGLVHFITGYGSSFAFFLIGAILIIPGGYQCWNLFQAWRRRPGYSFDNMILNE
jgi:hypothetical protein